MTKKTFTKIIIITGYISFADEAEKNYIMSSLKRITYAMSDGNGIMTDMKETAIEVSKLEELPEDIQDFFQDEFEEEEE